MAGRPFLGGVPTRMDVDRLLGSIAAEPGTEVSCEQVAELIGVARHSHRFETVTGAWRRYLFKQRGLRVLREGGAFLFLTPGKALETATRDFRRVGRAAGRATVRTKTIDARQLSDQQKEEQRLLVRMGDELLAAADRGLRALAPPKPRSAVTANVRIFSKEGESK